MEVVIHAVRNSSTDVLPWKTMNCQWRLKWDAPIIRSNTVLHSLTEQWTELLIRSEILDCDHINVHVNDRVDNVIEVRAAHVGVDLGSVLNTTIGDSERVDSPVQVESVTTQIPGDPKFDPWPQVKGLTLRVPTIPRWQSTKTPWIFFFFLYIPLEFS